MATFLFLACILGVMQKNGPAQFAGLAIGLTLVVIQIAGINVTGFSVNPARSTVFGDLRARGTKMLCDLLGERLSLGQHEAAIEQFQYAKWLNPLDPQIYYLENRLARANFLLRRGTPRSEKLVAAGTAANLAFLPVLIDPVKAGGRRLAFTLQVKGDNALWRIEMRNGVILAEPAAAPLPDHIALAPVDLADFLLGLSPPAPGTPLAALHTALDRSGFVFLPNSPAAGLGGPACEVHLPG